jgi:hypothetical protein
MKVFTSPDNDQEYLNHRCLFLGGGITGCGDWQSEFISKLSPSCDEKHKSNPHFKLSLINPRRPDWNIHDPEISRKQIEWEYERIGTSFARLFWFCGETLCPITLFELGKCCTDRSRYLFVGCHPDYKRKFDVFHQMRLERPDVTVANSFDELFVRVSNFLLR